VLILIISHAHTGIPLSEQKPLPELFTALARMVAAMTADKWQRQVRRLNDWFKIASQRKDT
jgi:hypothetical protein